MNNIFTVKKAATRDGFGEALVELGKADPHVVVLTGDLEESTRAEKFAKSFPDRFFELGVAEQNLMGVAAGLALSGKIPFVCSYAAFSPGRSWDQLRVSVCYSQANVKIMGGHAGLSVGPDGATHQALEDIAMTRCLPNLTVICPCDAEEARKATLAAARVSGPVYLRFSREPTPILTTPADPFEIGKAQVLQQGSDVTLISCGILLFQVFEAAQELGRDGISVEIINCPTVKPLDAHALLLSIQKTRAVVTVEEHQIMGGFGSAVAELVVQNFPVPIEMVGMHDHFGESGTATELFAKYRMTTSYIVEAAHRVFTRRKNA